MNFSELFESELDVDDEFYDLDRVKELAEVFTPAEIVVKMLDTLPDSVWNPHPSQTFLEPSCGNGNFLVEILKKKSYVVFEQLGGATIRESSKRESLSFYLLEALSSIYGVDVSDINIQGRQENESYGARSRVLKVFAELSQFLLDKDSIEFKNLIRNAKFIVQNNIQIGNMLEKDSQGEPTDRDSMVFLEYEWHPESFEVTIYQTTYGQMKDSALDEISGVQSLFEPESPMELWSGSAFEIWKASQN